MQTICNWIEIKCFNYHLTVSDFNNYWAVVIISKVIYNPQHFNIYKTIIILTSKDPKEPLQPVVMTKCQVMMSSYRTCIKQHVGQVSGQSTINYGEYIRGTLCPTPVRRKLTRLTIVVWYGKVEVAVLYS